MSLLRRPDWQARFSEFLSESATKKFAYGKNDCCLWVADAVLAMTGTDLAASYRGRYRSCEEAGQIARARGGLRQLIGEEMKVRGLAETPVTHAQRGDVVLVKRSCGVSLGILSLNGKDILAAAAEGFLRLPLTLALRAWRI